MAAADEQIWMKTALRLAARGRETASPNPMVGAVVVNFGSVVGTGWHRRAGSPHAEVNALAEAGEQARGATVYVTLEPCAHHGRTPPCAEALVRAGVSRVVVAMVDPDPRTAGRGLSHLRSAGIESECGFLEHEARTLNEAYIHHRMSGRPFVTLKSAATLDGRTAAADGTSRWITGEPARRDAHRLRRRCDAVCAGVGTVLSDNPRLTVRGMPVRRPPVRVVVDSQARTPKGAKVLSDEAPTVIVTAINEADARLDHFKDAGASVISAPGADGKVSLPDMLDRLGDRGILSMLLEGGATLAGGFAKERLIDRFVFYLAPKLLGDSVQGCFVGWAAGSIDQAVRLENSSVRRLGEDLCITSYPVHT